MFSRESWISTVPYCGAAPVPGAERWNFDPLLLIALLVFAAFYGIAFRSWLGHGLGRRQAAAFALGWGVLAVAFVSPLCNLGVALFSVRVTQHMLTTIVAAPLLVAGGLDLMLLRLLVRRTGERPTGRTALTASLVFAVALWAWHLPPLYDATFPSHGAYWAMQLTLIGTALLLWHVMLRAGSGHAFANASFTSLQMGALAALFTLLPRAIFAPHFGTTGPWGLSPLEDQQLGGLIMWVPAGLLLTVEILYSLAARLQEMERLQASAGRNVHANHGL